MRALLLTLLLCQSQGQTQSQEGEWRELTGEELAAFAFFDRNESGYLRVDDLETLLSTLSLYLPLPLRQIHFLASKCAEFNKVHYRKIRMPVRPAQS
jgi:hypothetical protein